MPSVRVNRHIEGVTRAREETDPLAEYRVAGRQTALLDPGGHLTRGQYDELVDADGRIRPMWRELADDFAEQGAQALVGLSDRVRRLVQDDGITYTDIETDGSAPSAPQPWRLDPVPLLVSSDDWDRLEKGLIQRSRVLDAVLSDLYSERRALTSGLLPPEVVFGHIGYVRAAHGITIPGRHQLFLHGCDVSRASDGGFAVSADWTQAPSGAGYALADRRVVASAIPETFEHSAPRPLQPFVRAMRLMLQDAAPFASDEDPTVVVLSPGAHSETAFDQAYLASMLGFPLVESADLVVRDGRLWMRSLGTLEPVDVVLRRVDAEFSDPLDLRPDSQLGVPGLVEVLRRGAVTVVNTLGSGVLESPALANYLPGLAQALLNEELLLPAVPAYWGGVPSERSHLLAKLDQLVVRSAVTGQTIEVAALTKRKRRELHDRISAQGWQWVGREPTQHAIAPAVAGHGTLTAAPVGMRLFTLARRTGYTPLAGGLGQLLAYGDDGLARPVAAKDVWVRAPARPAPLDTRVGVVERPARFEVPEVDVIATPRVLDDLFWMGRYAARAENAVRILQAAHDAYQDYRYRPEHEEAASLPVLAHTVALVTGTVSMGRDLGELLVSLTVERDQVGSLAYAIWRYGDAARSVRDQLSHDIWMVLSSVDQALADYRRSKTRDEAQLTTLHSAVLAGLLALSGVNAESMVRDSGWYAMDIGTRIERGLALTALLRATLTLPRTEALDRRITESVLRAAESTITHRRRHHGRIRVANVAQLMLLDASNPRSLAYQLVTLSSDLRALPGMPTSARPVRLASEAAALLSRVDPADLETVDNTTGERSELAQLLLREDALLREISDTLEASNLSLPHAPQPLWGTTKVVH